MQQPHLFPRWDILLKMYVSDVVVPLTQVQFVSRQFHNRCRIATRQRPDELHWCTIPVNLPQGRATVIADVAIADGRAASSKLLRTFEHFYGRTPGWAEAEPLITYVCRAVERASLADATMASMSGLLDLLDWNGRIFDGEVAYATEKNQRLARLTEDAGCTLYHCGPLGIPFLRPAVFHERGVTPVVLTTDKVAETLPLSMTGSRSALDILCRWGVERTKLEMDRSAALVFSGDRWAWSC